MQIKHDQSRGKASDVNEQGQQENWVEPNILTVSEPVTHQTEHAVQGLSVHNDLGKGYFLTRWKFILNTWNEGNESEHESGDGPDFLVSVF